MQRRDRHIVIIVCAALGSLECLLLRLWQRYRYTVWRWRDDFAHRLPPTSLQDDGLGRCEAGRRCDTCARSELVVGRFYVRIGCWRHRGGAKSSAAWCDPRWWSLCCCWTLRRRRLRSGEGGRGQLWRRLSRPSSQDAHARREDEAAGSSSRLASACSHAVVDDDLANFKRSLVISPRHDASFDEGRPRRPSRHAVRGRGDSTAGLLLGVGRARSIWRRRRRREALCLG